MKIGRWVTGFLGAVLLVSPLTAWEAPKKEVVPEVDKSVKDVRWEGVADIDMLKQVRADIDAARRDKDVKTLRVALLSPGGPAVTALEIARLTRQASTKGLVMELHAEALCASACTLILAAGTPGKRFVADSTLMLVHPLQQGSGWGAATCVKYVHDPKTESDKVGNAVMDLFRDAYVRYTARPAAEVEQWLTCDNEQAGGGELAVKLGMADKVE